MIIGDFAEKDIERYRLNGYDTKHLKRIVNIDLYADLKQACSDLVNEIIDDELFTDVEWNFMHYWYDERGFTEDEWRYVRACGYEPYQFKREDDDYDD